MKNNFYNVVTKNNYELIDYLNSLLEECNVEKRITLEIVDTQNEIGAIILIPSIFNPNIDPYEIKIIKKFKDTDLTTLQLVEMINTDITDLLKALKPDFIKLTRIKRNFNYESDQILDNTKIINFNYTYYEDNDRHNK